MSWQPLSTETSLQNLAYSKLTEIQETLLANKNPIGEESLFGGSLGSVLFFLYYYKLTKEERNLNIAQELLDNAYDSIA